MRGFMLLFNNWYRSRLFFWGMTAVTVVVGLFPFFFHEALGSKEYLFPKMYLSFPMMLYAEVGLTYGCRDIGSNRLMRSLPIAKELYTRSLPMFITAMVVGVSAVMLTAYFIFLGAIGAEPAQFSDTLVCCAIFCLPVLILAPLGARVPAGGVIIVFFLYVPAIIVLLVGGDKVKSGGFGLPLRAAIAIFAAALAVGIWFAFWISAARYKKSNVKIAEYYLPVD